MTYSLSAVSPHMISCGTSTPLFAEAQSPAERYAGAVSVCTGEVERMRRAYDSQSGYVSSIPRLMQEFD